MRRTVSGLVVMVSFLVPAAWPKHQQDAPAPLFALFTAPEFRFSQIDTICVAPPIDLRSDKNLPLGSKESDVVNILKYIGYKTAICGPVDATLGDLKAPSDAWLSKLNFGESRWLFILAIEDVGEPTHQPFMVEVWGYAVVSGYLFEKDATGTKLVWRDRDLGRPTRFSHMVIAGNPPFIGPKKQENGFQIANGATLLFAKFETRGKVIHFPGRVRTQVFAVPCNALWNSVTDTLRNSGKYDLIAIDDSDMMAVYGPSPAEKKYMLPMASVVLRSEKQSCTTQNIETAPEIGTADLTKALTPSVSK